MQARPSPQQITARITSCKSLVALGGLLQEEWGQLNEIHAAAALVKACDIAALQQGRLLPDEEETLALAAELFDERLGLMGGRGLSNAFHAMVTARHEPANGLRGRVLAALLAVGGAKLRSERLQGTSNVLWALAKLIEHGKERIDPAGVAVLVGVASGKLRAPDTVSQNLSNIAWALAELGHEDCTFMGELLAAAQEQLPAFQPQELSNTVWAAATLALPLPASFLGAFLAAAGAQLPAFKPQELSNTVWPATLSLPLPPSFLGAFLAAAGAQLPAFKPQHLSNTAWALAKLSLHVDSKSRSLGEPLGQPSPAQRLGWPKAQLQRFLGALADEAARRLGPGSPSAAGWTAQHLANTIWAFSVLRHFHAGLWGAVTVEALARCRRGEDSGWSGQAVSSLALGLARLRASERGSPGPLLAQLLQRLGSRLVAERPQAFGTQGVCNLAWAHAAAGAPYCAWLMEGLVLPLAGAGRNCEDKSQLLQYFKAMERPGSGMPPAVEQRPEYRRLRQWCKGP
jgi:hypothetical protein